LSIVWLQRWVPTPFHIAGATMLVVASLGYGVLRWIAHKNEGENKTLKPNLVENY